MDLPSIMIPSAGTRALLLEAKHRGVDIEKLIRAQNLDPKSLLGDPDFLIPSLALRALWKDLHLISGDPLLALHTAQLIPDNAYPVTDHLVRVAANVRDAFLSVSRYWQITIPSLQMTFTCGAQGAVFELNSLTPRGVEVTREMTEYTFALILHRIQKFSTKPWNPVRIELKGEYPSNKEHEKVFRCPVTFGAKTNRVFIDNGTLEIKQVASDPSVFAILTRLADQELKKLALPPIKSPEVEIEDTTDRVREVLQASLSSGVISVEVVASRLGMSSRTLQRKLEAEGSSYQDVLDRLRMELADHFLKQRAQGKMTVDDISFLLGFSEPSAFYKAYKRWTGKNLPTRSVA